MKNFIFKSSEEDSGLIKNLFNKLDMLLDEERHQRMDLADINRLLGLLVTDRKLQKQVDDYFDKVESCRDGQDNSCLYVCNVFYTVYWS